MCARAEVVDRVARCLIPPDCAGVAGVEVDFAAAMCPLPSSDEGDEESDALVDFACNGF